MILTFALDRHIPVEDKVEDILVQLEDAGIELGRDDLLPQNITLEEALAMHVGDVLHYEVSMPTDIPGTSSLDILAVVVQRSFEKHTPEKEAEFHLMIRPDMIIPYGPITASIDELYQVQMANLIDPARLTEHGINLTVSQVLNSYTAGRAEICLTAIE